MSILRAKLIAFCIVLIGATLDAGAQVPNKACPKGTLLFAYGDSAGCIKPGTNEVVVKCFRQKTCPSGWNGAGLPDDRGYELCCLAPAPPKQDSLEEMLNKNYPNQYQELPETAAIIGTVRGKLELYDDGWA